MEGEHAHVFDHKHSPPHPSLFSQSRVGIKSSQGMIYSAGPFSLASVPAEEDSFSLLSLPQHFPQPLSAQGFVGGTLEQKIAPYFAQILQPIIVHATPDLSLGAYALLWDVNNRQIMAAPVINTATGRTHERETLLHAQPALPESNLVIAESILSARDGLFRARPELRYSNLFYMPRKWVKDLVSACLTEDAAHIKSLAHDPRLLCWSFNHESGEYAAHGQRILSFACHRGTVASVIALLEAAEYHQRGLALVLLMQKDREGFTPVQRAMQRVDDPRMIRTLAYYLGEHVTRVEPVHFYSETASQQRQMTAMHLAAMSNNVAALRTLLADKTHVNRVDANDNSPLHLAAICGHWEAAELLLANGASLSQKNGKGKTASELARKYGHTKVVAKLGMVMGAGAVEAELQRDQLQIRTLQQQLDQARLQLRLQEDKQKQLVSENKLLHQQQATLQTKYPELTRLGISETVEDPGKLRHVLALQLPHHPLANYVELTLPDSKMATKTFTSTPWPTNPLELLAVIPAADAVVCSASGQLQYTNLSSRVSQVLVWNFWAYKPMVSVASDGGQMACLSSSGLKLWNISSLHECSEVVVLPQPIEASALQMLPQKNQVAFAMTRSQHAIVIRDVVQDKVIRTLSGHGTRVNFLVQATPQTLLSGARDGTVKVWDLATGKCLRTMSHSGLSAMAVLPPGGRMVTGAKDGSMKLWDIVKGRCLATHAPEKRVYGKGLQAFAVQTNGRVVSGKEDGTIELWDPTPNELQRVTVIQPPSRTPIVALGVTSTDAIVSNAGKVMHIWKGGHGATMDISFRERLQKAGAELSVNEGQIKITLVTPDLADLEACEQTLSLLCKEHEKNLKFTITELELEISGIPTATLAQEIAALCEQFGATRKVLPPDPDPIPDLAPLPGPLETKLQLTHPAPVGQSFGAALLSGFLSWFAPAPPKPVAPASSPSKVPAPPSAPPLPLGPGGPTFYHQLSAGAGLPPPEKLGSLVSTFQPSS